MRNFSMKKLGTPMRAGPGCASESVGFWSVGEPSELRVGFAGSGVAARWTLPASDSALASAGCEAPAVGDGVRTVPPPRLGAEPPFDDVFWPPAREWSGVAEGDGLGDGVAVRVGEGWGAGVAPGVGVATGPRSVMLDAGAGRPGIVTEVGDTPGGTSTVTTIVCPVTSLTCSRCNSADAVAVSSA